MVYVIVKCENGRPVEAKIELEKPEPKENEVVFQTTVPQARYEQLSLFDDEELQEKPAQIPGQLSMFD